MALATATAGAAQAGLPPGTTLLELGQWLLAQPPDVLTALAVEGGPSVLATFEAAVELARSAVDVQSYMREPSAWVRKYVSFPPGKSMAPYQAEALDTLATEHRLALRGPNGLGKTAVEAWAILHFALTRDAAGIQWKIPTMAGVGRQLVHFLWPEIHLWAGRLRWDLLGRAPFTPDELMRLRLRLAYGEAWAQTGKDPAKIEGAHATHLLYVFTEAKAIEDPMWDAAEGASAGAGADTGAEAWALASSTPGRKSGRFFKLHARAKGYEDWTARHVKLAEAVAAGQVSADWAVARARQWGTTKALFQNRVLGNFADESANTVIFLEWVEAAIDRWHDLATHGVDLGPVVGAGLDIARCFDDQTELLTDEGWKRFADVTGDEQVLSLDLKDDHAKWAPITDVHRYDFDGHLNLYDGQRLNFAVTDDHRLITRHDSPRVQGFWHIRKFNDLPRFFRVRRTNTWAGWNPETVTFKSIVPLPYGGERRKEWTFDFLDWASFLGWFVAEGNVYRERREWGRCRVTISQNRGPKFEAIGALLKRMGIKARCGPKYWEFTNAPIGEWLIEHCGVGAAQKCVPVSIREATPPAMTAFLDGMMEGDGSRGALGQRTYNTSSRLLADQTQEMLVKLGRAGKIGHHYHAGSTGYIGERLITRKHAGISIYERSSPTDCLVDKTKVQRVPYQGVVSCVSTPMQTIMVRRKGCAMWSGNSGEDESVLALTCADTVLECIRPTEATVPTLVARVRIELARFPGRPVLVVDADGIGAGYYDALVNHVDYQDRTHAFRAAGATDWRDYTGELQMANQRAAAWWALREELDPNRPGAPPTLALPPDDLLIGDLCEPTWKEGQGGRVLIESKDDIRKRLGRSTDTADAVVQSRLAVRLGTIGLVTAASHRVPGSVDLRRAVDAAGPKGGDWNPARVNF